MKFLRLLLNCLLLVLILAALLAGVAFVPDVQTWVAQTALARKPDLQGSLGSLNAGFGKVEVTNLRLNVGGAILTVPSLEARIPLLKAAWNRKIQAQSLVAKDWTLDLSGGPAGAAMGAEAAAEGAPAQKLVVLFRSLLGGGKLLSEGSFDGIDLEGDVLVATQPGNAPSRMHVTIKGGSLGPGREGDFTFDAVRDVMAPGFRLITVAAHGHLVVAAETSGILNRIEFKGDLSAEGGSLPKNTRLSADLAIARGASEERYTLDLSRGSRRLATVLARSPDTGLRLVGNWKIDLRDSDLAPFVPDQALPTFAVTGEGVIETDAAFARVQARGVLTAAGSHWGTLAPALDRIGTATLDTRFDFTRSGHSFRFDHLSASLAGTRPIVSVQALQPFDFDGATGKLKLTDPGAAWAEGSIRDFPLAWLSGLTGRFSFAGGDATGGFVVRPTKGGFALLPTLPLTAAGVSIESGGRTLGRGLDLSLSLHADYAPGSWQVQWAPLAIGQAGRQLATSEGKASRVGDSDEPIAITGTWKADLEALAAPPAIPGFSWITARSASGDFSASLGGQTVVEGNLAVVGHDPGRSVTASLRANFNADGSVNFNVPVKIVSGTNGTDVSAEGKWTPEETGSRVDLRLASENLALDDLRLLAAPMAAAAGVPLPPSLNAAAGTGHPAAEGRDRIPFWGNGEGRVTFAFDRLKTAGRELSDVSGSFDLDHGSLRLTGGRGGLPHHVPARLEGSIVFDPAAPIPYALKATAAIDEVDAAPFFAAPTSGEPAGVEGRFSVAGTITGSGINLADLIGRSQEEFRFTSSKNGGILRLLKTSVAEAIPQVSTPVKDAVGGVGSFVVGSIFGMKRDSLESNKNPISKNADAVLNFTDQIAEIGYDQITVTAVRGSDGTIRLVQLAMTAPEECLTGSGQISSVAGLTLDAQPLSVDLQFGARGAIAELLQTAGLLSPVKDQQGYTLLNESIHFGGTLAHLDESQWHDLLARAATRKPDAPKSGK